MEVFSVKLDNTSKRRIELTNEDLIVKFEKVTDYNLLK